MRSSGIPLGEMWFEITFYTFLNSYFNIYLITILGRVMYLQVLQDCPLITSIFLMWLLKHYFVPNCIPSQLYQIFDNNSSVPQINDVSQPPRFQVERTNVYRTTLLVQLRDKGGHMILTNGRRSLSMKSFQLSKFVSKCWSPCWKCENIGNVRMGEREWHKMWDNWESTNVTFAQGDEEGETVGQDVSTSLEGFRFACDLWWHAFSNQWWLFHTRCNGILVPFCLCPFHCDLCSKMFTSSSLHSRHIQIHSS